MKEVFSRAIMLYIVLLNSNLSIIVTKGLLCVPISLASVNSHDSSNNVSSQIGYLRLQMNGNSSLRARYKGF